MMNGRFLLSIMTIMVIGLSPFIQDAFAQSDINSTDSGICFLNYTAGVDMWRNCGMHEDYLAAILLPFEWVTGGLFSAIIVAIIIIMVWMKYHNALYPMAIGIVMMPTSYYLFPTMFLSFAIIMAFIGVGAMIWYIIVRQTKEY